MSATAPAVTNSNPRFNDDSSNIAGLFDLDFVDRCEPTALLSESIVEPEVDRFGIYLSSILGMTAFVLLVVGAPVSFALGLEWGAGVGAMTALWVGPGFGLMIAGMRIVNLDEQRAAVAVAR